MIRPARRPREFQDREAQRRLRQKENRWAPAAYAVAALAAFVIFFVAYTSYAFSKYHNEILPGVQVDQVHLAGLTQGQAKTVLTNQLAAIHLVPVRLTYPGHAAWKPTAGEIGLGYRIDATAQDAINVGRTGSVIEQWIDRFPLHAVHSVPLLYTINERQLRLYLGNVAAALFAPASNAKLVNTAANNYKVMLVPSRAGIRLDLAAAEQGVHTALGSLSVQSEPLRVNHLAPPITDADAQRVRARVEAFLARPPIINVGRRVFVTPRSALGPMLSFTNQTINRHPTIVMQVDPNRVQTYVASLAAQVDRQAQDAKLQFLAGSVQVIQQQQSGRVLDQQVAYQSLLGAIKALKQNARLRFQVTTTRPPIDQSNPASLGIRTLLGFGTTSFSGAGPTRLTDITAIARSLNQDLLTPSGDISFNSLVGTGWANHVYSDRGQAVNGQIIPGGGGAMQQVATTFLRAMYDSGLTLEERHAHVYRLPWYEPPVGLDAVVAPGRGWDLRFANSTHRYLLIETRVEPIRQQLYIYVYGPKLGWKVSVDPQGKVVRTYQHGPPIVRQDSSLLPGQIQHLSFALNGADTAVQRTVALPNGSVKVDQIDTHYQPSQSIISQGLSPTAQPKHTATARGKPRATPTVTPLAGTPSAGATPTPTFSH